MIIVLKKFFEGLFKIAKWALIFLLTLSWASGFIDPKVYWPASFFSLLFPYLYVSGVLVASIGLLLKNHKAWLVMLLLVLFSGTFRKSFFNISISPNSVDGLALVTHNIGSSLSKNKKPEWKFYKSMNADIYCFQEWNARPAIKLIQDSLLKTYYTTLTLLNNPRPIFSKYPVIRQGEIISKAKGNGSTWADIVWKGDTIRIFNIHLASNRISGQTEDLIQTKTIRSGNAWQRIKGVLIRYRDALLIRTDQSKELAQRINKSPYPVIIAGDFNDTPSSFVYRLLQKGMHDSFLEAGSGMGYTYAGRLPFLHIDHVLHQDRFICLKLQIKRVNYSDHYPVKVVLNKK